MQYDYGKFILKQLDYSPEISTSDSQRGAASLTVCSYKTRARSLIVKYYSFRLIQAVIISLWLKRRLTASAHDQHSATYQADQLNIPFPTAQDWDFADTSVKDREIRCR